MENLTNKTHTEAPQSKKRHQLIVILMGIAFFSLIFMAIYQFTQPDTIINNYINENNQDKQSLDLEKSIWGNISSGDESQVFLYDYNNNVTAIGGIVYLNCSVNITKVGVTIKNMSLWTNSTGTWHRNQTLDLGGASTTEAHGETYTSTTGAHNTYYGFKIKVGGQDIKVTKVGRQELSTQPDALILDAAKLVLANVTWDDEDANFNYTLSANTEYYLVQSGGGVSRSGTGNFPYTETDFNWTGAIEANADTTANVFDIVNMSYTIESDFRNNLFNTTINDTTLWGCSASDSEEVEGFSIENKTVSPLIFLNTETFVSPTTAGATNPFTLNLTTNGPQITVAYLNYNNTNLLASISSSGNEYVLTKNQIAPAVVTTTNIPFSWNITMSNGFNTLTSSQNQSVAPIVINETCSGTMSVLFNFTTLDEITKVKLDGVTQNTSMKMDLNLYTSDRTVKLVDYFNEFSNTNPSAVCIASNLTGGEQYSLDLQVQYSAANNSVEFYNIERLVLNSSNLHQNISLYDLDTTNTQAFRLRVRDTSYLPIDGALIQIERKYIENGTFFITEIPKADEGGISSASLQTNNVVYNFKIYDAGVLVSTFNNVLAICQTPLVSTCEIDFNAFQSGITVPDYEEGDDFNFTLGYNDSSKIITSQFVIPSGEPSTVLLQVIREDTLGTAVCTDTLTSASGTLSCVVPSSFGNSTVVAKIYKDSIEQGKGNIKSDQKSQDIFPGVIILLSVIVMITLVGMGVSDNPIVTALFLFVGVVVLFGINLIQNTGFVGATATILFFAIAIILVIIKAARRN